MGRFVIAGFATVVIWLMFRAPTSFNIESALLFLAALLGCYMVIWNDLVFGQLGGDHYTYGLVARSVSFIGFLITLIAALRGYYLILGAPKAFGVVSPYNWAFVVFGLFVPFWLPISSSRNVAPLSQKSVRREFEDPKQ